MFTGRVLYFDSKARIGVLPMYLVGFKANEISLKLQRPLLTRWWNVNFCSMQFIASYKSWVKLFDHLHESRQGDRISPIDQNSIYFGKSKNLKCDGAFFCAFIRAY